MSQGIHLRKYNVQTTIDFELYEVDGVNFRVDAVDAGADCNIMKDEGAEATCANDFTDEGNGYSLVLTATEMQAARIVLYIIDSATKVWLDKTIIIETYGHASAMHGFDLDTALDSNITTIASDLVVVDSNIDSILSDIIVADSNLDAVLSDLTVADAIIDTIYSDTTAISSGINTAQSDLIVIDSDINTIQSDLVIADSVIDTVASDLIVTDAVVDTAYSDTTAIASGINTVQSDLIVADAVIDTIYSDTAVIASGVNTAQSDLVVADSNIDSILSDIAIADSIIDTIASDLIITDAVADAIKVVTDNLASSATTIVSGTVSWDNTNATTTVFYSDDITEATADHYKGRIIIFTSGAVQNQASDITAYALDTGEGKFTVTALTEAPADNVTFVIV